MVRAMFLMKIECTVEDYAQDCCLCVAHSRNVRKEQYTKYKKDKWETRDAREQVQRVTNKIRGNKT